MFLIVKRTEGNKNDTEMFTIRRWNHLWRLEKDTDQVFNKNYIYKNTQVYHYCMCILR